MECPFERFVETMTVTQFAETLGLSVGGLIALLLAHHGARLAAEASNSRADHLARGVAAGSPRYLGSATVPRTYDTRTISGRAVLDLAILAFLDAQPRGVRAVEIRGAIGGTPRQIRARLASLVADGDVQRSGRASGTRYYTGASDTHPHVGAS